VNLSAVQFKKDNLIDVILCALVDSGLPPERLEVEITETALMTSDANYLSLMHRLKNLGVLITVDDFGTGYSSLSYLTMFPFDRIKIDRSFVQNLTKRADCAAIISAVLALGAGLDMKTVAEGVETQQQLQLLRSAGVDFVQGYMFGRPCPVADLILDQACASPALQPSAKSGEARPAQASIEAIL
jgi:EAL domain-containing protein (putative c-di-GMP-specific phosphodiesterase class I)